MSQTASFSWINGDSDAISAEVVGFGKKGGKNVRQISDEYPYKCALFGSAKEEGCLKKNLPNVNQNESFDFESLATIGSTMWIRRIFV